MHARWRRYTSVDGFFRKCSGLELVQSCRSEAIAPTERFRWKTDYADMCDRSCGPDGYAVRYRSKSLTASWRRPRSFGRVCIPVLPGGGPDVSQDRGCTRKSQACRSVVLTVECENAPLRGTRTLRRCAAPVSTVTPMDRKGVPHDRPGRRSYAISAAATNSPSRPRPSSLTRL